MTGGENPGRVVFWILAQAVAAKRKRAIHFKNRPFVYVMPAGLAQSPKIKRSASGPYHGIDPGLIPRHGPRIGTAC